jgi:hypothetical protein
MGVAVGGDDPAIVAFFNELTVQGFVEGRNVGIEYRWAEHRYDRLPELAAELVRSRVAVIVATGNMVTALAAKAVTDNSDSLHELRRPSQAGRRQPQPTSGNITESATWLWVARAARTPT